MPLSHRRDAERKRRERAAKRAAERGKGGVNPYRGKGLADGRAAGRGKVYPMSGKAMVGYMKYLGERGKTLMFVDWVTGEILEVPVGDWGYSVGSTGVGRDWRS